MGHANAEYVGIQAKVFAIAIRSAEIESLMQEHNKPQDVLTGIQPPGVEIGYIGACNFNTIDSHVRPLVVCGPAV